MATLYLHIGTPKTGTTSLQYFLWDNRQILEQHGICFPEMTFRYGTKSYRRNGHFLVEPALDEKGGVNYKIPPRDYHAGLSLLTSFGRQYDTVLLSDEGLWWGSLYYPEYWPRLNADLRRCGFDVKIIVYLRRQDLWAESNWAQRIKEGATYDFAACNRTLRKNPDPLDYYEYVQHLLSVFGREALHVRIYEKDAFEGAERNIHSDFLKILGLTLQDGFTLSPYSYNQKLEGNYLEIKRLLNYLPALRRDKHPLTLTLQEIREANPFRRRFHAATYFSPEQRDAFLKHYAASNERLAREYFGREDGILFHDIPEELPAFKRDDHELLNDVIQVYGKMFDKMITRQEALEKQLENQKAQIAEEQAMLRALRKELRDVRENVLLYRLKRKARHLTRRDNPS